MSLTIYYSDRIEDLADDLKEKLGKERRASDPFAFSTVVVPNTNIAKWLQIDKFSDTRELCVGVEFPFMEKRLTDLLRRNLPKDRKFSLLPDNAYANAILAALLEEAHPEFAAFAPFRAYISGGAADTSKPLDISTRKSARMAWQLATKLANLMDQYEVRRPEIVENWLKGLAADGGSEAQQVINAEELLAMRAAARSVPIAASVQEYALRLVLATHPETADAPEAAKKYLRFGASPRAAQALLSASRVRALAKGRYNVAYEDIRFAAPACLRHRAALNFEAVTAGKDMESVLADILAAVPEKYTC